MDDENPFLYKNYFLYFKETGNLENGCQAIEIALEKDMRDYGDESDTEALLKLRKEHCGK